MQASVMTKQGDRSIIAVDPPGAWQDFLQYTNTSLQTAYN